MQNKLSQETLFELLTLDEDTGTLFWKKREPKWFVGGVRPIDKRAQAWNSRYAGKEAFSAVSDQGYKNGKILNHSVRAHQIVWTMIHGAWPNQQIDHQDGNRLNNSPKNLRQVTSSENSRNRKVSSKNTSGVVGVYKRRGKWVANIYKKVGKKSHLGTFLTFAEAVKVRRLAEKNLDYHENHGRVSCV